jgi:PhoD-like phosphatase
MPDILPITFPNYRLRLPKDGPMIGWTRWSDDGQSVLVNVFATPDDSESDPAAGLLVSYADATGDRQLSGIPRSQLKNDFQARAPFFNGMLAIPAAEFTNGKIVLEVLTLHAIAKKGQVYQAPDQESLIHGLAANTNSKYDELRAELDERLRTANTLLIDPKPSSHSFEDRSDRSLEEATVTLRLPLAEGKAEGAADSLKLIATTCRYPGFAFESKRVDSASFEKIVASHSEASAMLLLGDQIYADATASLFDNLTTIEKFQERYHALFRSSAFAKAVRSIPTYMTGDDHEFSNSWSKPDDALNDQLCTVARQSYGIYQVSHSPFSGQLDQPPYDYSFNVGPAGVYVMDTLSNRDTRVPGEEAIVCDVQLDRFEHWLKDPKTPHFVILATGGVVAPGLSVALDADGQTDVHRAQGWENWQAFNDQRVRLLKIIEASSDKQILLISGDYHCAGVASIKATNGREIAKAVVVPPAYAPMRYVNQASAKLAIKEKTVGFQIDLDVEKSTDGSGFAVITLKDNAWHIEFDVVPVAGV